SSAGSLAGAAISSFAGLATGRCWRRCSPARCGAFSITRLILVGFEAYENRAIGLAIFPVFTILQSILQGWLRQRTGSIWTSCVAHSAANGIGGSVTAYLFLGGGHFLLTSHAGVLGCTPLRILR